MIFDFSVVSGTMKCMELRHLRTIVAVDRHRSFTRAAEELHLAQSAISQQIRKLETELGIEVFRRTSRCRTSSTARSEATASTASLTAFRAGLSWATPVHDTPAATRRGYAPSRDREVQDSFRDRTDHLR